MIGSASQSLIVQILYAGVIAPVLMRMLRFSASRRYANRKEQREHDGHDPARMPQREALAECRDGAPLDRGSHAGGRQGVSAVEGSQAVTGLAGGTPCKPDTTGRRQGRCSRSRRCVGSYRVMAVRRVSTESGTSPDGCVGRTAVRGDLDPEQRPPVHPVACFVRYKIGLRKVRNEVSY